jgi:pilus assembly protein Flp/PilA
MEKLKKFLKDEEGASMPEYALLVALIAVVVIAGATILGTAVVQMGTPSSKDEEGVQLHCL